jgi:uncharacterized protein (TIGR02246 family)
MKPRSRPIVSLAALFAWGLFNVVAGAGAQDPGESRGFGVPAKSSQREKTGSPVAAASALSDRPQEEKAIREMALAFTRAFGAGDSKSVAAMYSEDAELTDELGGRNEGRAAIEEFYSSLFRSRPGAAIEISIESLRFLSPEVAKEEGHTRLKSAGWPETLRRYTVLYVKKDGRWLYSSDREDHSASVAHHEHLKALAWLVGDWVDQSSESTVHATCRWSPDKNFLLRDFTVHVQGRPVMTVSQRIGWDPLTKQIKSWVFDSEGGYGDELWARKGNQWVIKSTAVLPDGRTGSATHLLTPAGPNSARWSSTERTIGEQTVGEPVEYTMVRRAPAPQANRNP